MTDLTALTCSVETTSDAPFVITSASVSWFSTWGFKPAECIGKSISVLNGEGYDRAAAKALVEQFERNGEASVRCTNPTADGR